MRPKSPALLIPVLMLIVAMSSIQGGASLAKSLFPLVGATGATALRLTYAALILLLVWRPWRTPIAGAQWPMLLVYGVSLGLMNLLFYMALQTLPLGVATAIEFVGPLGVTVMASRRPLDFVWVGLAFAGLICLAPLDPHQRPLEGLGIVYALAAGLCWGVYILAGQKAGAEHGGRTVALGMTIGAVVAAPIGAAHLGLGLFAPNLILIAIGMALLTSVVPYSCEMFAMTRLPTRTFGVLMSGEPAVGALSGLIFLHEALSALQMAAIALIIAASVGAIVSARAGTSAEPVAQV